MHHNLPMGGTAILLAILILQCYSDALQTSHQSFIRPNVSSHLKNDFSTKTRKSFLSMICSVKIRIVGRKNAGEPWINDAYSSYETRLRGTIEIETIWHKSDQELVTAISLDCKKGHSVILLDPLGKTYSSEKFSDQLYSWFDVGGSRITFVIGGADGLPTELKNNIFLIGSPHASLSLSSLTMTHQFSKVLLIEQIYRASEIRKGSGYHK
mmetsp:Transcript_8099/g.11794  ORF Transcript_8099/g.11794 Transcript_8099/m.11794 type:complete len:211 (+) Transcript_8099:1616-2248(+)